VSLPPPLLWPPQAAAKPPAPVRISQWIDVSNYQGKLEADWFTHWGARGYGGLIVQAVRGYAGEVMTQQQLAAALDAGWDIAGYIWCWSGQIHNLASVHERLHYFDGFNLDFLAVDIEDPRTSYGDAQATLRVADTYQQDQAWVYTAKRVFDRLGWAAEDWWRERKLWAANYDGIADVDVGFVPFGGWTQAEMKQFTDVPVDQNVRR
jgi:hypothetical protein